MPQSPVQALTDLGQSPWLDFIQRDMIPDGLVEMQQRYGIRGVTSNPAIFEQAIGKTEHYDDDIRDLAAEISDIDALYERLVLDDIAGAADAFRPIYDACDGADGFVSLEVSPRLAHDTQGTIEEARRLWTALDRPNVMIKVPATPAGMPAIRQLIAEGINVNVTLLFAVDAYIEVAEAYVAGLEDRAANGLPIDRVASVASFFISRLDAAVDAQLDAKGDAARELRGKAAIANGRQAYARYQACFGSDRFQALAAKGARTQRVLWASTSTKDPSYSDVLYVETLIGPDTVNTLPLATIEAFDDHGEPRDALTTDASNPDDVIAAIAGTGVDLAAITDELLRDGVVKFEQAFDALLAAIERKRSEAAQRG